MSDKPKVRFKWLEKLKNVKHIEIIVVVIFLIILFLIWTSTFNTTSKSSNQTTQEKELTITNYVANLEDNLETTISKIKGVSDVKVMITLDMKNAIIEESIIKTETFPNIRGIVIVAKGVENTNVKLNVLKAVQAVIDISSGCVEILSSN